MIRIPRFRARRPAADAERGGDGLAAFASEERPASSARPGRRRWRAMAGLAVVLAVAAAFQLAGQTAADAPADAGRLTVTTRPAGAHVWIDGRSHGRTPLDVRLPPGNYLLDIRSGVHRRVMPVSVAAGSAAHHYLEWVE